MFTVGRAARLAAYQNPSYARRFRTTIASVRAAETAAEPASTALTDAACRSLYQLMAYKDEYEVARLLVDPAFLRQLDDTFEGANNQARQRGMLHDCVQSTSPKPDARQAA